MDPQKRFSTNISPYYEHISNITNNSIPTILPSNVNHSTPLASSYFHRTSLILPNQYQHRLRSPPPRFSSSYLGPLHQHRPRFLSAWDLTSRPTIYNSSRNISVATPTPISMSKQHDKGSCILNSCAFLQLGVLQNCVIFFSSLHSMPICISKRFSIAIIY